MSKYADDFSYFFQVRKNFLRAVSADHHNAEMWLEFEGMPLKWYVLF